MYIKIQNYWEYKCILLAYLLLHDIIKFSIVYNEIFYTTIWHFTHVHTYIHTYIILLQIILFMGQFWMLFLEYLNYRLYATYIGSISSARKESRRFILCFSPREFIGMEPGSTTTTIPVTNWCSSSNTVVMTGTISSASFSSP